jgi:leucyl/phenylalanyl-tRNA---protein transferase
MHGPYWLQQDDLSFPDPEQALNDPNGLLAIGGDLSLERLRAAYSPYCGGLPTLAWCSFQMNYMYPKVCKN